VASPPGPSSFPSEPTITFFHIKGPPVSARRFCLRRTTQGGSLEEIIFFVQFPPFPLPTSPSCQISQHHAPPRFPDVRSLAARPPKYALLFFPGGCTYIVEIPVVYHLRSRSSSSSLCFFNRTKTLSFFLSLELNLPLTPFFPHPLGYLLPFPSGARPRSPSTLVLKTNVFSPIPPFRSEWNEFLPFPLGFRYLSTFLARMSLTH